MADYDDARSMKQTVREYRPRVDELCPERSRDTYNTGFDRLVGSYGDRRLSAIHLADLTALRDRTIREVGQRIVDRAQLTGRPLRNYESRAHGYGAGENLVRSCRFFFRCAVDDALIVTSPADRLSVPRRPPAPERALTAEELHEIYTIAATTGGDPELDCLILDFLRETAARRGGALTLSLGALNTARRSVTLAEKGGTTHEVPCSSSLLDRLIVHAYSRGAARPADGVLRYADGRPITRKKFNSLFDRIDRHTTWTEALDVGAHWIRHTTLSDIAIATDIRIAAAYAGHSPDSVGVTFIYTRPTFEELRSAHDLVFGDAVDYSPERDVTRPTRSQPTGPVA